MLNSLRPAVQAVSPVVAKALPVAGTLGAVAGAVVLNAMLGTAIGTRLNSLAGARFCALERWLAHQVRRRGDSRAAILTRRVDEEIGRRIAAGLLVEPQADGPSTGRGLPPGHPDGGAPAGT